MAARMRVQSTCISSAWRVILKVSVIGKSFLNYQGVSNIGNAPIVAYLANENSTVGLPTKLYRVEPHSSCLLRILSHMRGEKDHDVRLSRQTIHRHDMPCYTHVVPFDRERRASCSGWLSPVGKELIKGNLNYAASESGIFFPTETVARHKAITFL